MPILRAAIDEARAAGLTPESEALATQSFACCTTSDEWLGETGLALTAFLSENRARLAPSTVRKLEECLREISKVWPRFHPWLSR